MKRKKASKVWVDREALRRHLDGGKPKGTVLSLLPQVPLKGWHDLEPGKALKSKEKTDQERRKSKSA